MKVLALNSSARTGDVSKTEIMTNCLVEGMRDAGAEVEVVNLKKKKINYCSGCFTCWTKTPGICMFRDDMSKEIFPKFRDCDLCVLATPLFHYTVNAQMKTFIERTLPMAQPFFVEKNGVTTHPIRHEPPPVAVISVAGFPEETVFDQLKSYVQFLYGDRLVAEIYRSAAEMFRADPNEKSLKDVLEATVQGGRELVESMQISPDTLERIKRPISDFEKMSGLGNLAWQTCIDEGVTLGEFQKRGMVPRPNSIETFLAVMKVGFNAETSGDDRLTMQYNFNGQVEGNCYFMIDKGEFAAVEGTIDDPDLTINAPFEVWMDILTRKAEGAEMLMEGKYSVEGQTDLLLNMNKYFGRG